MSAPEPGEALQFTHAPEIPVRFVQMWLCDPCIDGQGEECHTPGCALWLNRPPDMPLRENPVVSVTDEAPSPGLHLRLIESHERAMDAARIDMTRGDYGAAARLLDEQLDGYDGLPWNGTDTGLEWLEKARAAARQEDDANPKEDQ